MEPGMWIGSLSQVARSSGDGDGSRVSATLFMASYSQLAPSLFKTEGANVNQELKLQRESPFVVQSELDFDERCFRPRRNARLHRAENLKQPQTIAVSQFDHEMSRVRSYPLDARYLDDGKGCLLGLTSSITSRSTNIM